MQTLHSPVAVTTFSNFETEVFTFSLSFIGINFLNNCYFLKQLEFFIIRNLEKPLEIFICGGCFVFYNFVQESFQKVHLSWDVNFLIIRLLREGWNLLFDRNIKVTHMPGYCLTSIFLSH